MSTLEIVLTVAVVWLLGAHVIVQIEERYRKDEITALTLWPLVLPVVGAIRGYRRWRYTCRDCKRNYGDRKHYDLHMIHRTRCTVPPAGEPDVRDTEGRRP